MKVKGKDTNFSYMNINSELRSPQEMPTKINAINFAPNKLEITGKSVRKSSSRCNCETISKM